MAPMTLMAQPPKGKGRWVLAAAGAWLAVAVLHMVFTGRWWVWLLPGLAPPVVFAIVPTVLAALAFRAGRGWWRVVVLALAALAITADQTGLKPPQARPDTDPPPGAVRVISWNTEFWDQYDDPDHFYRFLRGLDADVYLLQEYQHFDAGPAYVDDMARIRREFNGYHIEVFGELLTLSRLAIMRTVRLYADAPPPDAAYPQWWVVKSLRTDVMLAGRMVSIYNVHIPVQVDITINPLTWRFYDNVRVQDERRRRHIAALRADLAANPGTKLVAGDFNSSPSMAEVRGLPGVRDLTPLLPAVYPASWHGIGGPWWRLDWAFASGDLTVVSYEFIDTQGLSDHRAQRLVVDPGRKA